MSGRVRRQGTPFPFEGVHAQGLHGFGWVAVAALLLGLLAAAVLLAPWRLKFAIDARELYEDLYEQAAAEAEDDTLGWLATAGYSYQALRTTLRRQ
jgi:hypothetical protein